jgi:F-type H+-transporting ATPase subunit delta
MLSFWINSLRRSRVVERATIARPYAKAAFECAREANAFGQWSQGLRVAAEIVTDPRVASLIKDPEWPVPEVARLITDVAAPQFDAAMQNFIRVLAENHRLLLLPEIAAHYESERAAVENTIDVEVISAVPLSAAQAGKLAAALTSRLKRRVRMQNSVDAALLGGAVIRAGDLVIDGSLKGRLERLETELAS